MGPVACVPLYSALPPHEQQKVFDPAPAAKVRRGNIAWWEGRGRGELEGEGEGEREEDGEGEGDILTPQTPCRNPAEPPRCEIVPKLNAKPYTACRSLAAPRGARLWCQLTSPKPRSQSTALSMSLTLASGTQAHARTRTHTGIHTVTHTCCNQASTHSRTHAHTHTLAYEQP